VADRRLGAELRANAVRGYADYLRAESPIDASRAFGSYRVMCAHRDGRFGVSALNPLLERALAEEGLLRNDGPWYARRPVMVRENDYAVKLFNGDVGIVFADPEDPRRRRVHFVTADGEDRPLAPSRLPAHETVFAMTVHKSQGSEFDEVAVVLPDAATKVLTRELLYTAVTRARARVSIFGSADVVRAAVERPIVRASGLRERLWGPAPGEEDSSLPQVCAALVEAAQP
jgi:exodeoxyribonuclease V alpha subunit